MKKKNLSGTCTSFSLLQLIVRKKFLNLVKTKRGWDKSPSLSIIFGLSSKTQWLSGLYYADFISFYSPTQLCGGGTTKSNYRFLSHSQTLFPCIITFLPYVNVGRENLRQTVYSSTLTGTRPQICSGNWGWPS